MSSEIEKGGHMFKRAVALLVFLSCMSFNKGWCVVNCLGSRTKMETDSFDEQAVLASCFSDCIISVNEFPRCLSLLVIFHYQTQHHAKVL